MESNDKSQGNVKMDRRLPENCMEYIAVLAGNRLQSQAHLSKLEAIRKDALDRSRKLTEKYIWQRDGFNLELVHDSSLIYLKGITDYGDAIEDEWLIVYLLRELTMAYPDLWIHVSDADGEFLLIEAADVLPSWLNPEVDHFRVWVHQGKLLLIPLESDGAPCPLTIHQAAEFLQHKSTEAIHSPFIQAEAFYRLDKYPDYIEQSLHSSLVTIPRRLAYLIHALPKSISAGIESFYLRDAIGLKRILDDGGPLLFPPTDLVTISVSFSRILFAQLRSQQFDFPPIWKTALNIRTYSGANSTVDRDATALQDGMKLTCGYEMLASNASSHKQRVVRELAIMLEDLNEDGEAILPSDQDISSWPNFNRHDDDSWMDINYEEFEKELEGRSKNGSGGAKYTGFGDVKTQQDLRKVVSKFEAFLNDDKAGVEGVHLDGMDANEEDNDSNSDDSDHNSDDEDKLVSFDEEEFSQMMKEMMGFPVPTGLSNRSNQNDVNISKTSNSKNYSHEEATAEELSTQMEKELKSLGALKLTPSGAKHTIAGETTQSSENIDSEESDQDVAIDLNLAQNLLESFKSQAGMPGPTGNLLGLMGFRLPRDEEDEADGGK